MGAVGIISVKVHSFVTFLNPNVSPQFCDSPDPRQAPNPHFLEKRVLFRGPKTPISLCPHTGWKREFLVQKSPFPLCFLAGKRGFFDRKLPFPGRGKMGIFGPRNPLFQKTGIRGLSGVRGIATSVFNLEAVEAPPKPLGEGLFKSHSCSMRLAAGGWTDHAVGEACLSAACSSQL